MVKKIMKVPETEFAILAKYSRKVSQKRFLKDFQKVVLSPKFHVVWPTLLTMLGVIDMTFHICHIDSSYLSYWFHICHSILTNIYFKPLNQIFSRFSENFHLNRRLFHFLDLKGVDHLQRKYSKYFFKKIKIYCSHPYIAIWI